MASTSIGEYAVRVTGDARQFTSEMAKVAEAAKATAVSVKATSVEVQAVAGSGKNATFAIQQLALGVQDAASVFGTGGFSGAIRAAGNNIVQFASLLGPLAGTFAAFATTGIQLVTDYFTKSGNAAAKAADEFKNFRSEVEKNKGLADQRKEMTGISGITTAADADKQMKDVAAQRKEADAQLADNARSIEAEQRKIDTIRGRLEPFLRSVGMQDKPLSVRDRFLSSREREDIALAEREIGRLRDSSLKIETGSAPLLAQEQALAKRRGELQLKEALNVEVEAFGKGGPANAKAEEAARKRAVSFENERQKLIVSSNREMMAEEEQRAARRRAFDPLTNAASFGSASAADALARARAVPNEQVDIDRQVLAVQQKALSELSEIRLNTKTKQAPAVVEDFN